MGMGRTSLQKINKFFSKTDGVKPNTNIYVLFTTFLNFS